MKLSLHNTLSGEFEEVVPLEPPTVRIYACGPTVYSRAHIGNFRYFVTTDLLRRTLKHLGYGVYEVMNVTDVDDRIIQLAQQAGTDLASFTARHIASFEEDLEALRIERPEEVPRATDHIPEMIALIEQLGERGRTYSANGSVYFRIKTFPEYGRLSRLDVAGIQAGARVDTDKYDKDDARDFVLWKHKEDEPEWAQWDAPFGKGRPGWHLECSAMSGKYLGETFDIHCGGVDLIFPHHENEIAQSRGGTDGEFAKHWLHVEHLLIESETMSKSKGNVFSIPDLVERGYRPDAIRYLLLQAHYRKKMNFTWEGLDHAAAALERIRGFARRLEEVDRPGACPENVWAAVEVSATQFDAALADDLNAPEALAAVHGLVSVGNSRLADGSLTSEGVQLFARQLEKMDTVFGVFLPGGEEGLTVDEQELLDGRNAARLARDFAKADTLRDSLLERGIVLEDSSKGTRWRRTK